MRTRTVLLIIATVLFATVASAAQYYCYAVLTFYDWKQIDQGMLQRAKIDRTFIDRYAYNAMEPGLNAGAAQGWEPVTTTFIPGTPGADDPRRAADKLVIITRNPNPPPKKQ